MPEGFPEIFLERLQKIVPQEQLDRVMASFSSSRAISVRVNTLKTTKEELLRILKDRKIAFKEIPQAAEALILEDASSQEFAASDLEERRFLYRQGLSSMLAAVVLDPRPGEYVLDMCAAPGSKATQMAARMNNRGEMVCLETVRGRYYKLKNVIRLMGAENISCRLMDARRFRAGGRLFDRILVDAPCSSEGRFKTDDPKTYRYWSPRKIKEMLRKQRGLLLSASRMLRPGGTLAYATCTFAPEENEGVIHWLLKKTGGTLDVEEVSLPGVESYPAIQDWGNKPFDPRVKKCFRVLPGRTTEGFFIAKLTKSGIDTAKR